MSWTPILPPERGGAILADIVAAIEDHAAANPCALADLAIVRSYLAADGAVPDADDRAGDALVASIEALAQIGGAAPSLHGGFVQIGWTIAHLRGGGDADAVCETIDSALLGLLEHDGHAYDLIKGLVGMGVYALERGEPGLAIARGVVAGLETYQARGWFTPWALVRDEPIPGAPHGRIDFGLAHGIAGVIALLARFCEGDIERTRSRAVLDSALRCLLDGNPRRARGRFPPWYPVSRPATARLAWCYQDLGAAAALLGAGLALDLEEARDAGLALAIDCATRSVADAQISDACLCHGAAGIAHLFNRMAQATGAAALHDAAQRWLAQLFAMRGTAALAGFPANIPTVDGHTRLVADGTLLRGAGGVALVLHAACSTIEPAWDRLLLVDLPPRG